MAHRATQVVESTRTQPVVGVAPARLGLDDAPVLELAQVVADGGRQGTGGLSEVAGTQLFGGQQADQPSPQRVSEQPSETVVEGRRMTSCHGVVNSHGGLNRAPPTLIGASPIRPPFALSGVECASWVLALSVCECYLLLDRPGESRRNRVT